jgi:hypothetical protein
MEIGGTTTLSYVIVAVSVMELRATKATYADAIVIRG